jgi:TonB-dependent starch-binding outer membrane protein SusC
MSKIGMYVIILVQSATVVFATESEAQRRYLSDITIDLEKERTESLTALVSLIESKSEFTFAYLEKSLRQREVHLAARYWKMDELLREISVQAKVSLKRVNESIAIVNAKEVDYFPDLTEEVNLWKAVSGKVLDEAGGPLPGATVLEKGTSNGTTTNIDGYFQLECAENAVLVVSFVGYRSQEIAVNAQSVISVQLTPDLGQLEEVVVIGYGSVKKSDLTGSVSSVDSEELSSFPTTNVSQALQGRAAGVHIQQNSGAPGAPIQVRIRGTNSIQGGNEPLWIIDGFPSDPNLINSADIESVEVLKDASATAIYGSRGANGVIIITTKKGKAGVTKVDYQGSFSLQQVRKKLDLMNAEEYARFYNIFWNNTQGQDFFTPQDIAGMGRGTDWQNLVFRTAPVQNHNLNVSGGNDKTKFLIGTSYFDQAGIIKDNDYRRIVLRTQIDHSISDKLSVEFGSILTRTDENPTSDSEVLLAALSAAPTVGPYYDNGDYLILNEVYPFSPDNLINPIAYFNEVSNSNVSNRVMANMAINYKPMKDLTLRISGNVINSDYRSDFYRGLAYPQSSGSASINTSNSLNLNNYNVLTYNKEINSRNRLTFTGAFTYEEYKYKSLNAAGSGFLSDATETYNLGSATTPGIPSSSYQDWKLLSYLSRLNYELDGKYLLTLSFRGDGSSRYSKGNKWGYFPSGAVAWRFSDEDFMSGLSFLSDSKVRVGYGESGSTSISPYYTLDMLTSGKTGFQDDQYTYFAPGTRLPGSLRWETTRQIDFGLDLGFIDNRLRLTVDYYVKNTRDLLNTVQLPVSLGYSNTVRNIGEIRNSGLELQADANIIDRAFKWNVSANISFNKNSVVKLYEGQDIRGSVFGVNVANDYINLLREGSPISAFYGYKLAGFDESGHYTYQDLNGDGEVNADDKTWIGNPNPDFIYGLNSNLSYKNFDLNIFIQGSQGNDIYALSMVNQNYKWYIGYNLSREVLNDHWSPENTDAKYPNIDQTFSTEMADNFVYNGSYLRLKNIGLAYNFPVADNSMNWIKGGQVYVSGQNLLTLTSYPWWDPEVNSRGGSNSINQGIDYYSYPTSKGYTIGVKLSF